MRAFISGVTLVLAGCLSLLPVVDAQPAISDRIVFYNGHILTMEDSQPVAEAMAVIGNTITQIGSNRDLLPLARRQGATLIDLEGKTMLPGFVDPHNHIYNRVFLGGDFPGYAEAEQHLLEIGTTTVGNANIWPDAIVAFLPFAEAGLRVRTSLYVGYNTNCGEVWPAGWYDQYKITRNPNAMLRIPGIKVFTDGGSCDKRGAFIWWPDGGDQFLTAEEIAEVVEMAEVAGFQVLIHALGDYAVESALDGVELALAGRDNYLGHRIDHNRMIRPSQLPRYGELGITPVVFGDPVTCSIVDPDTFLYQFNDPPEGGLLELVRSWWSPWKLLVEANPGQPVAWKSDYPSFRSSALAGLWQLVTRNSIDEDGSVCVAPEWLAAGGVSVETGLKMITINAAHALLMDQRIGSLRPGKFADAVILSADPLTIDPEDIIDIDVLMTMVGGKPEYCAAGAEAYCAWP